MRVGLGSTERKGEIERPFIEVLFCYLKFYSSLSKRFKCEQVKAREHCEGARTSVRNPSNAERNAEMRSISSVYHAMFITRLRLNGVDTSVGRLAKRFGRD